MAFDSHPYLCNQTRGGNVYFKYSAVSVFDSSDKVYPAMSIEQVLDKVEKSYWRTIGWGAAFGLLGAIPSAMNVASTNEKIRKDYEERSIKDGDIDSDATREGVSFFSIPPETSSLDGWRVQIMLLDPKTSENILMDHALSGAVEPRKAKEDEADQKPDETEQG